MVGGLGLKGLGVWGLGLLAARRLEVRCRHGTPANPEMRGGTFCEGFWADRGSFQGPESQGM